MLHAGLFLNFSLFYLHLKINYNLIKFVIEVNNVDIRSGEIAQCGKTTTIVLF